jgi:hypothetical protein
VRLLFHRELTTVLTTTMTTVALPDASTYMTIELVSCLVAPSACVYGSEGWGFVKGHEDLPVDGHEICPVVATRSARSWPPDVPGGYVKAFTPLPARAWVRRTLSPLVWQTWAWCSSRSTVAVASVLGISSSNPAG